jgi:tetratricopeptide (TPR) repeat protein
MRDDFPEDVRRVVALRVGTRCSNPECQALTSGPQIDPTKALNVGVAAHITAASPGGARYDPSLSPQERSGPGNGIWLCQTHAKLVDNDATRFPVQLLREWKKDAEARAGGQIGKPDVSLEAGALRLHVKDVQRCPVVGLQIGVEGSGGSSITDDEGKARITLGEQTREKTWVSLQILKSPPGKDFVIVSPWDRKTLIPPFDNEVENFVPIVVVQRGDREALENGAVLAALAARINQAPKIAGVQSYEEDSMANLAAVAQQYGLTPDGLDQALRRLRAKAADPYEAGQAALYSRNYSDAAAQFATSLEQREERLASDQRAVADAAFFLGQALDEEGRYREAAAAYRRCLEVRPDDSLVLNNLALSLFHAGDYADAELRYQRALSINRENLGPDHPLIAINLNNIAEILRVQGRYTDAEPLYRRAIAIDEKALGPDHPNVASFLSNFGLLLKAKREYTGAESLYRRALAIREQALGPDDRRVAMSLDNLGKLLRQGKGDHAAAEPLHRRALAINEKALRPDHPLLAPTLDNLASVLQAKGEYVEAELLFRRALAITEKALGPEHPQVALSLNNLGFLLQVKGDKEAAEPLYRRALAINERAFGPNHPHTQQIRGNLESLLNR